MRTSRQTGARGKEERRRGALSSSAKVVDFSVLNS
jgi:hypothetical protein